MCPIIKFFNYIYRELDQRAGSRGVDIVDQPSCMLQDTVLPACDQMPPSQRLSHSHTSAFQPVIHSERDTADPTRHFEMLMKNGKPYRIILGGYLFLPKQTRSGGLSVWRCQQYKTFSKCPGRISARVDPSEPVSAQYDHNHAPPTASALRKQRLKSTLFNADLLKGFAEISEDVEIRPSERKAARQVFYRLKNAKRYD